MEKTTTLDVFGGDHSRENGRSNGRIFAETKAPRKPTQARNTCGKAVPNKQL